MSALLALMQILGQPLTPPQGPLTPANGSLFVAEDDASASALFRASLEQAAQRMQQQVMKKKDGGEETAITTTNQLFRPLLPEQATLTPTVALVADAETAATQTEAGQEGDFASLWAMMFGGDDALAFGRPVRFETKGEAADAADATTDLDGGEMAMLPPGLLMLPIPPAMPYAAAGWRMSLRGEGGAGSESAGVPASGGVAHDVFPASDLALPEVLHFLSSREAAQAFSAVMPMPPAGVTSMEALQSGTMLSLPVLPLPVVSPPVVSPPVVSLGDYAPEAGVTSALPIMPIAGGAGGVELAPLPVASILADAPDAAPVVVSPSDLLPDAVSDGALSIQPEAFERSLDANRTAVAAGWSPSPAVSGGAFEPVLASDAVVDVSAVLPEDVSSSTSVDALPGVLSPVPHRVDEAQDIAKSLADTSRPTAFLPVKDQVQVQMQRAVAEGMDRISIRLDPAELGRVEVTLDMGADGVSHLHLMADKADTLEALQRDVKELARSLQQFGIRADGSQLSFSLRQDSQGFAQGQGSFDGATRPEWWDASDEDGDATGRDIATVMHRQRWSNKALDIEV